jgi:hypothetical protein
MSTPTFTIPSTALAPLNTALPTISGIPQVGQTLTATSGTWANIPTSITYLWIRSGVGIPGATASTYVPVLADVGLRLTLYVTAINGFGPSAHTTTVTGVIAAAAAAVSVPLNMVPPTITGTPQVGQMLTVSQGSWMFNPTSFSYQWFRAGAAIPGAAAATYLSVAADIGSALTGSVIATNPSGASAPSMSAPTAAITAVVTPPPTTQDGSAGAPSGTLQYPTLLAGYKVRPPWKVAGVDYHVGVPDGLVLKDWRTVAFPSSIDANKTTGLISIFADYVFDGIDFSLGVGARIYNPNGNGAPNFVKFNNCHFGLPSTAPDNWVNNLIQEQNGAALTITNTTIDGLNMKDMNQFVTMEVGGTCVIQYCWLKNSQAQIFSTNSANFTAYTFRFNLIDDINTHNSGAHMNWMQLYGSVALDVSYNTGIQRSLPGGEGFQPDAPLGMPNPNLSNNTMIAYLNNSVPGGPPQTISHFVHGGDSGVITGVGTLNNNYFDLTGAYGAYYAGTMTPAQGWASSGNIDMTTGGLVVPA